ncbi:MAG TPA: NAD(P)/FAD-dependent oxidoreductase [Candidatus Acidoferrales bacterium]|nr:NAD(P)/FAD-dependent oxidoreductase [Candidatus Acidoferrales bacterium]
MARPSVLVIGGGFGGLSAVQHLRTADADVTLLDRRNFHLFQPLMYQVATGSLSPGEIAAPLRSILNRQRNTRVLLGEAADLDPAQRVVTLSDDTQFHYDQLVVATGSKTSYYGHDEWRAFAQCPKSIEESTEIRRKIFYAFEAAERAAADTDEARSWLTFVIVGAGATGLELAGALAEIARQTLRHDFRAIRPQSSRILLIEVAPRVLPAYPEDLSRHAQALVERLGVQVLTNARVLDISEDAVTYEHDGTTTRLPTKTVLWAGGIAPTPFGELVAKRTSAPTDRAGRIQVGPDLTVPGHPEIFVVGDLAAAAGPGGGSLPGLAPVAMQEGAYAARVINARLRGVSAVPAFRYFNRGDMAVIGRAAAVANVFGVHVWGWPAWLLWLFIHLLYIVEFQSRLLVFIEWGFLYLTYSRGARLITGPPAPGERGANPRL